MTLEEYQKAKQIVKDYRVCSGYINGAACAKLLKVEEAEYTIQCGNEHWWCKDCYKNVKNDW